MKKLVKLTAILSLTVVTAIGVTGCGKKVECDICGETKKCKTEEVLGQKINICSDCESDIKDLGSMFQ